MCGATAGRASESGACGTELGPANGMEKCHSLICCSFLHSSVILQTLRSNPVPSSFPSSGQSKSLSEDAPVLVHLSI